MHLHQDTGRFRIGMFGRFGSGNSGNEGSLEAMLGFLRAELPHAELDVRCSGPEQVRDWHDVAASQMHWLHQAAPGRRSLLGRGLRVAGAVVMDAVGTARWVRRHDVVVVPGTGPLESTLQLRPWETPWALFLVCASGRLFGTRIALVSVGASPSRQRVIRWLFRGTATLAHYCSFRDDHSRESMRVDRPVHPDLVFAMPEVEPGAPNDPGRPPVIGVGVIDYHGSNDDRARAGAIHEAYVERIESVVVRLLDEGCDVRLLTGDRDDEVVVRRLLAQLPRPAAERRLLFDRADTLTALMAQLATTDLVVASRFHNVLCALKCGVPTVSLGYGVKHRALMQQFGQDALCQDLHDLDVDLLWTQIGAARAGAARIRAQLLAASAGQREALSGQFTVLREDLFAVGARPRTASG